MPSSILEGTGPLYLLLNSDLSHVCHGRVIFYELIDDQHASGLIVIPGAEGFAGARPRKTFKTECRFFVPVSDLSSKGQHFAEPTGTLSRLEDSTNGNDPPLGSGFTTIALTRGILKDCQFVTIGKTPIEKTDFVNTAMDI